MPFKLTKIGEEKLPSTGLGRGAATIPAIGARAAETALGQPGSIIQAGQQALTVGMPQFNPSLFGQLMSGASSVLPSTERLREGTQALTGQALEPQNELERSLDDLVSDVTALSLPGLKIGKGRLLSSLRNTLPKALGIAVPAQTVKYMAKEFGGFEEPTAEKLKLGTMFLTSLGLGGGLSKKIDEFYAPANAVPENIRIPARQAFDKLNKLELQVAGRSFPGKDTVQDVIEAAQNSFSGNTIDFQKAWNVSKDANKWYPKIDRAARKELSKVTRILKDDVLYKAPELIRDPELVPLLKQASEGMKMGDTLLRDQLSSSAVRDWMNQHISLSKYGAGTIIGHILGVPAAKYGAGLLAAKQAINFVEPILRSPKIFKTYVNILGHAAKENTPAFLKSVAKLDKQLQQETPTQYRLTKLGA